ncbi:iron-sulfur cluster biosynthesis family protein [Paenibacillus larvae]|nr:iron-sulfur cluster biosynthesis family protein [Paenibacillus larvae]MDT2273842.1 iron-sulfur cluster biosynthesis family protein [Paenibacillus larvae]
MHLTITETAERILSPLLQEPSTWLKLVYDIEGCGCAVDGVPALWLVNECKPTDKIAREAHSMYYITLSRRSF